MEVRPSPAREARGYRASRAENRVRAGADAAFRFAGDSPLEEAGFEPSVPLRNQRTLWLHSELFDPMIAAHNGRLVKTIGDGFLVEFSSVVDALRCATEVQAGMGEHNATVPAHKRIEFRIGINMGDIVVEDGDIFGDGENVGAMSRRAVAGTAQFSF